MTWVFGLLMLFLFFLFYVILIISGIKVTTFVDSQSLCQEAEVGMESSGYVLRVEREKEN